MQMAKPLLKTQTQKSASSKISCSKQTNSTSQYREPPQRRLMGFEREESTDQRIRGGE
jgi:hypothetical protein